MLLLMSCPDLTLSYLGDLGTFIWVQDTAQREHWTQKRKQEQIQYESFSILNIFLA